VAVLLREKIYQFLSKELTDIELGLLDTDLKNGAPTTRQLVEKRLRVLEREHQRVCVTCGQTIEPHQHKFVLNFGSDEFSKRANFCALTAKVTL